MRSNKEPSEGLIRTYVDLHVHLGWAGVPGGGVKIAAAKDLTLANILAECQKRKGIGMIGVIDAATSGALADLDRLVAAGDLFELPGGGLSYRGQVTLIPGAEVEVLHLPTRKPVHLLAYLPGLRPLKEFASWQKGRLKNSSLSTQRHHDTNAAEVVEVVAALGGFVIPAHIFTPFKALLAAASSVAEVIPRELWAHVPAVELGLSADTELAEHLPELTHFAYVTNADAHSLGKIGREYNLLHLAEPTFAELVKALRQVDGRRVAVNFGLDPRLGKYHRTYCLDCDLRLPGEPPVLCCPHRQSHRLVLGVLDRICMYRERQTDFAVKPRQRPPYMHQVPLQFVPGLGKRSLDRLLAAFGTEMAVLHQTTEADLAGVVGPKLAQLVVAARTGSLAIEAGAGGTYGKVLSGH